MKISASGTFRAPFESEIPMKGIRKEKDTAYVRTDVNTALYGLPGLLLMLATVVLSVPIIDYSTALFFALLVISVAFVGAGFILAKRSKAYIYHYESGAIAFDITESGNTSYDFETFCSSIETAIQNQNLRA